MKNIILLLVTTFLISCVGAGTSKSIPVAKESNFTLNLIPGEAYKATTWWFIFPVPIYPQVACWVETPQGDYVETLYVTEKAAKNSWISAPSEGRPEALPIWSHISKTKNNLDAVSAATPSGATDHESNTALQLAPGSYVVKLEINRSYDYNQFYTKENAGVTGQPSIIYVCNIKVGAGNQKEIFTPLGTGALDGTDGKIHSTLDKITTAFNLFSSAAISYTDRFSHE
jgi:hypothetical protein